MPESDSEARTIHNGPGPSEGNEERTLIRDSAPQGHESLSEVTRISEGGSPVPFEFAQVEATQVLVRAVEAPGEPKGMQFGRYQLLTELGRGGMGIVFKAWDTQLRRIVALKMVLPTFHERRTLIERFMREAQLAAKLRHPHIVGVLDVGNVGPQHFFTSDFIDGPSLHVAMKEPSRRYPDLGEMAADLGRYLDGEPIHARPVSWIGRVWRKAKRNRTVAMLGVALATTLVGVLLMASSRA